MAVWRRKAMAAFPTLRQMLHDPEYTIYSLFSDLVRQVHEAHQARDTEQLRAIYGFASWCSTQKSKEPSNAAAVAFYEHLLDGDQRLWPEILSWLSPATLREVWPLWEWWLPAEKFEKLKHLEKVRRQR
ncbi:MAG TPA: hypothetical protein VGY58_10555 [Gemmataceae bacterium]|nr:hypothetical protein [Gemmataceae bacterium]